MTLKRRKPFRPV